MCRPVLLKLLNSVLVFSQKEELFIRQCINDSNNQTL